MAKITTNTAGTQPSLWITTTFTNGVADFSDDAGILAVTCLQDITITNSTGVYSYTSFCDTSTRKLTTPADNSLSTNIVVDDAVFFGDSTKTAASAAHSGLSKLSNDGTKIGFRVYWNDNTGATATSKYRQGQGFITNLAPTVGVDAPVWVSPVEIAVDGGYTDGVGAI
jgi:uncharacterized protein YcfL